MTKKNNAPFVIKAILIRFFVVLFLLLTFMPLYIMIINSLKTRVQILDSILIPSFGNLQFSNYASAFNAIIPYVLNSIMVTLAAAAGVVFLSVLSGYAFGRFHFKGKKLFFTLILVNMMIPSLLTLVPNFFIISNIIPLYDTPFALIVPYIVGGQVMGIFLARGFVEQLPSSLFEAAKLDGATEMQTFFKVAVPLLVPVISTIAVLNVINTWNEIVWPNLVIDTDRFKTIPQGLLAFNSFFGNDYGRIFAGYVIASVPLLIFFLINMKGFMNSLTEGAIK